MRPHERDAVLHDEKLEGQFMVTFREVSGHTETFHCEGFPTKPKAIRAISHFKNEEAWERLADE